MQLINAWNRFCCRRAKAWLDKLIIETPSSSAELPSPTSCWVKAALIYLNELEKSFTKEKK